MLERRASRQGGQSERKQKPFLRFLFYFTFVVFLAVIVYVLLFSPYLKISSWRIEGIRHMEEPLLADHLRSRIDSKVFQIFQRGNLLLFDTAAAEKALLESFSLVRKAEIAKRFPDAITVSIEERIPTLVICARECLILDESGEAFEKAEERRDLVENFSLIELRDESAREIKLGESVMDLETLQFLSKIKGKIFQELDIETDKEIWTPTVVSGDFRLKTMEGWNILFGRSTEPDKMIGIIKAVLNEKIAKDQRGDLEYIDLRISSKVFYKFREGTQAEEQRLSEQEEKASEPVASKKDKKKD